MVFVMASLGLPGLGNFVGEFLVLMGAYKVNITMTALAAVGLVFATVYSLWIMQRAFHGPIQEDLKLPDLSVRDMAMMLALIVAIVWLGLYPQPVLNTTKPALEELQERTSQRSALLPNREMYGTRLEKHVISQCVHRDLVQALQLSQPKSSAV